MSNALDAYIAALKSQDWLYEYSDDHRAWTAGKDAMHALRAAQRQLDPQGIVWNQYAPRDAQIASK